MIQYVMVSLDPGQETLAAKYGAEKYAYALSKNYRQAGASHTEEEHIANEELGYRGEMALAMFLALPWRPNIGRLGDADVGGLVDIRTRRITERNPDPELNVFPKDRDASPFVHAVEWPNGAIELRGWMFGADAKKKAGPMNAKCKASFVANEHLRALDLLLPMVAAWKRDRRFKAWLDRGPYHKF